VLGQHFLVEAATVSRIVAALAPRPGEPLLEIGPGRGALTFELLRRAGRLAAVEVDPQLSRALAARCAPEALLLFEQDVRTLDFGRVLEHLGAPASARLAVVGNLPYSVSKPIATLLFEQRAHVDRAVLMFQREVAARLTALPGSRACGPLGLLLGLAFRVERLFDVPPRAFRPVPAVCSSVTRFVPRPDADPLDDEELARVRLVLGACFARRRRTLRNNLTLALGDRERAEALLQAAEIDGEGLTRIEFETLRSPARRRAAVKEMRRRAGVAAARLLARLQREQIDLAMIASRVATPDDPALVEQREYCRSLRDALVAMPGAQRAAAHSEPPGR